MASSRIIVTKDMGNSEFEDLMVLLGNYFESDVYIDKVDGSYTSPESLMFQTDMNGNRTKTHTKLAFEAAQNIPQKIYFAGLANVKLENLTSYFAPIIKHAKNPTARYGFTAHNERNIETVYSVPQNVWFILNLDEEESLADLPASLAEIASIPDIYFEECIASEAHENIRKFTYYQMEYLCEKLASKFEVSELTWKKVDRLESFVASHAPYQINNKLWLCLEKYVAVMSVCGAEENRAIDEAVAAKLLPSVITLLDGKLGRNDTTLTEALENAFGEDNIAACRKLIKTGGANVI
jgi:hypothetical protein